jgi:hypothetical protein
MELSPQKLLSTEKINRRHQVLNKRDLSECFHDRQLDTAASDCLVITKASQVLVIN